MENTLLRETSVLLLLSLPLSKKLCDTGNFSKLQYLWRATLLSLLQVLLINQLLIYLTLSSFGLDIVVLFSAILIGGLYISPNGFSSPAADGGSHNADTPQDNERR